MANQVFGSQQFDSLRVVELADDTIPLSLTIIVENIGDGGFPATYVEIPAIYKRYR